MRKKIKFEDYVDLFVSDGFSCVIPQHVDFITQKFGDLEINVIDLLDHLNSLDSIGKWPSIELLEISYKQKLLALFEKLEEDQSFDSIGISLTFEEVIQAYEKCPSIVEENLTYKDISKFNIPSLGAELLDENQVRAFSYNLYHLVANINRDRSLGMYLTYLISNYPIIQEAFIKKISEVTSIPAEKLSFLR